MREQSRMRIPSLVDARVVSCVEDQGHIIALALYTKNNMLVNVRVKRVDSIIRSDEGGV